MSEAVELLVSLKIPDVTAITARRTLQNRMGYGEVLRDLRRADWWRLELAVDDFDAALALGRELAEQTNCFVNPNKHVYDCLPRVELPAVEDGSAAAVLVGFYDEATASMTQRALQGRLGYGGQVLKVDRGTLWTFILAEPEPAKAQALVEAMTISGGRESGLLVNPHSMWHRWIGDEVTARG